MSIREYIDSKEEHKIYKLNELYDLIKSAIPNSKEKISWGMPTFYYDKNIIHFASFKNHIGIYPGPDAIIEFKDRLKEYKTSKGAIQIPYEKDLPKELIKDIAIWCYKNRGVK